MAEVAGLVIGSVSLLALFQSCLDTCENISSLRHKSNDLNFYLTKLAFEKYRLAHLKQQLGISENRAKQTLVINTLKAIQQVLDELLGLIKQHVGAESSDGEVVKRGNSFSRAMKWVSGNSTRMSALIGRLSDLNEQLTMLLDPDQVQGVQFGVMARAIVTSDVAELRNVEAAAAQSHVSIAIAANIKVSKLEEESEAAELPEPVKSQIPDLKAFTWLLGPNQTEVSLGEATERDQVLARYRTVDKDEPREVAVLVEWREGFRSTTSVASRRHRLDRLCSTLRHISGTGSAGAAENQTSQHPGDFVSFGILKCLGWVVSGANFSRIGLVFELPTGGNGPQLSLNQQIQRDRQTRLDPPALGARFAIALGLTKRLANLIVVGWAHKAVRSHNVLIYPSNSGQGLAADPDQTESDYADQSQWDIYLTGFSYARPTPKNGPPDPDLSILPTDKASFALYRPPRSATSKQELLMSGNPTTDIDIYGLGIILLEIGLWRTIRSIYEEAYRSQKSGSVNLTVDAFLGSKYLERTIDSLSPRTGVIYREVVKLCLGLRTWGQPTLSRPGLEAQTNPTLGLNGEYELLRNIITSLSQCRA